ncbi:hypothetical protein PHISP_02267, partial [Aspergillus sp. HF37]
MGSSNLAKTILIPASIALTVYLVFSFVIIPVARRSHQRYANYLPLHAISAHTVSLRDRIGDVVVRAVLPETWRRGMRPEEQTDNASIYDEEGEILVGMNMDPARREALERRRSSTAGEDVEGRLSRDLEEGFMDD